MSGRRQDPRQSFHRCVDSFFQFFFVRTGNVPPILATVRIYPLVVFVGNPFTVRTPRLSVDARIKARLPSIRACFFIRPGTTPSNSIQFLPTFLSTAFSAGRLFVGSPCTGARGVLAVAGSKTCKEVCHRLKRCPTIRPPGASASAIPFSGIKIQRIKFT